MQLEGSHGQTLAMRMGEITTRADGRVEVEIQDPQHTAPAKWVLSEEEWKRLRNHLNGIKIKDRS